MRALVSPKKNHCRSSGSQPVDPATRTDDWRSLGRTEHFVVVPLAWESEEDWRYEKHPRKISVLVHKVDCRNWCRVAATSSWHYLRPVRHRSLRLIAGTRYSCRHTITDSYDFKNVPDLPNGSRGEVIRRNILGDGLSALRRDKT